MAAERNLDISRAQYKGGTALAIEVLDADNTLAQARMSLVKAIIRFNLGQARLMTAAGWLDRNSFDAVP